MSRVHHSKPAGSEYGSLRTSSTVLGSSMGPCSSTFSSARTQTRVESQRQHGSPLAAGREHRRCGDNLLQTLWYDDQRSGPGHERQEAQWLPRGRQPASTKWLTKFRHWLRVPEPVVSSRGGCIRSRFCSSASEYRKLNVAGLLRASCAFSLSCLTGPGRSSISSSSFLRD